LSLVIFYQALNLNQITWLISSYKIVLACRIFIDQDQYLQTPRALV